MFDFFSIESSSENPTFVLIMYTVLFCFLLSSLIAFTYEKTSRNIIKPVHYIQALILISIVAATVMQAIGDSVARGLGMLGALAIIRFRTTLRNPRNMVFMFASIAVGIACGVYAFVIAIVGTLSFCTVAVVLRLTPFSQVNNLIGILKFELGEHDTRLGEIKQILKAHSAQVVLKRYKVLNNIEKPNVVEYEYRIRLKEEEAGLRLTKVLRQIPEVQGVRLTLQDASEDI